MVGSLTAAPMVLILAIGLVAAGAVSRVVMKIAAARRAVAMINHTESDWVDDQWQPERRNGQEHEFADELEEGESVTSTASNYETLHPSRPGDEWPEHALNEGRAFQINEITKREDTLAQLNRDLHKALFVGGYRPWKIAARA
jgi:acyl-coenzyme A synthetase/AMP-(fatty) acid ligase